MKKRSAVTMLIIVALGGCAQSSKPYKTAPVSGVVTLDGKPLAQAHLTFLPLPDAKSASQTGPEALGDTDNSGRFSLKTVFGDEGASIGKNRVMISTRKTELDPSDPDKSKEVAKERVPGKYFTDQAPLHFEVPPSGSNSADFALKTN